MGNDVSKCLSDSTTSSSKINENERQMKIGIMREDVIQTNQLSNDLENNRLYKHRDSVSSFSITVKEYFNFGEKKCGIHGTGIVQDYNEIRDKCLRDGTLFEDETFPANNNSFYYSACPPHATFKWMRPSELTEKPMFISEGASRFDVCQGELGDCWLLAAVANLTLNEKLFHRVVPHDQTFDAPQYAGIYHFRFWQYGKWIDVVIDDRLPTVNNRLVLMHSKDKNEFWSALLEKAYAKLHGSYEALKGGTSCEAMEDFTGGVTEHFDLQSDECPPNLLQIMLKANQRHSLMGCCIESKDGVETELSNGLIRGHAYSITAVKLVELSSNLIQKKGKIPLIRVRNPWGNEAEWKGSWSDKSREWGVVSDKEKRELGLTFDADGEFYMSFTDFKNNFTRIEICNLTPDSLETDDKRHWETFSFDGSWVRGISSGGCRNNLTTFYTNPQYLITLVDHDEDDDDDLCTFILALMQKNHRIKRKMGLENLTIGFAIYEVKDGVQSPVADYRTGHRHLLTTEFFKYNASVARSPTFINLREVTARFRLKPGNYCVIPSTFDANEEGDFLLRIFTEKPPQNVAENDDDVGIVKPEPTINGGDEKINDDAPQHNATSTSTTEPLTDIFSFFTSCWNSIFSSSVNENINQTDMKKVESNVNDFFAKIAGEDLEVDANELLQILNHALKKAFSEFKFDGFSLDSCRSMVALLDGDKTGKLGFDEFKSLWRDIRQWCSIFRKHDADNSSTINASELRTALNEMGLNVNRTILQLIVFRYGINVGGSKKGELKEKALTFDDFIHASIKLKNCIDIWNQKNKESQNPNRIMPFSSSYSNYKSSGNAGTATASFTLEEFIEKVMYC